jgi:hypothetical protein
MKLLAALVLMVAVLQQAPAQSLSCIRKNLSST